MRSLAAAFAALALVAVPGALASEKHPKAAEVEAEIWCNWCKTTLDSTNSGRTREIVRYMEGRIAAGDKKSDVKKALVVRFGSLVSALPSKTEKQSPRLADLEGEVMCPVCNTTLDQSSSPAARQIKDFISARIAAGDSKNQIKDRLVADYGPYILAAPPKSGFNLLAWVLPFIGLLGGGLVLGFLAWRWSRGSGPGPGARTRLDPLLDRRVDEALARYDEG